VPLQQDPVGLLIYLHGLDDDHTVFQDEPKRVRVVERLLEDGYVVAASDAHLNDWGSPRSQDAYADLAADLAERYGTSRTFLLAESMGTPAALQLLTENRIPDLLGLAAVSPLVDLDVTLGTQQEDMVTRAWGGEFPTGTENPANLPTDAFAGARLRFYLAEEDTVTVSTENADPLLSRVDDVADVSVVNCEGGHVDDSCFQPDDLAAWFAQVVEETD
jgi:pimeloyl-ACP methyl ester carboxylesterase